MISSGGRAAVLMVLALAALTGCGGSDPTADREAQLVEARTYAAEVSAISQRTSRGLAGIADRSDFRDAETASASAREYGRVIRAAAGALAATSPPAAVRRDHEALVALYRSTAEEMEALAADFTQVSAGEALTAKAQELSAAVQRSSTREGELRTAIERALPAAAPVVTPTTPDGVFGGSDPG